MKKINPDQLSIEQLEYLQQFMQLDRIQRFEAVLAQRTRHLTVVLENIIDLHNISAVVRSAECFGLQDLYIISENTGYKPAKNILKGSNKWMDLFQYNEHENNSLTCIHELRKKGYKIVAATPHENGQSIQKLNIDHKTALIFGQERDGISDIVKKEADEFVMIPMQGFTESFNISVAAGIMIFELTKRLRNSSIDWQLNDDEKILLQKRWTYQSIYRPDLILARREADINSETK